jgi:hypothetical protein
MFIQGVPTGTKRELLQVVRLFRYCSILVAGVGAIVIFPAVAAEKVDPRQLSPAQLVGKPISSADFFVTAPLIADVIGPIPGFGANDKFAIERQSQTPAGSTQLHLRQTFNDVPMWGERVIMTRDKENKALRVNGILFRGIARDIETVVPKLRPQDALKIAKDAVANDRGLTVEALKFENEKSSFGIQWSNPASPGASASDWLALWGGAHGIAQFRSRLSRHHRSALGLTGGLAASCAEFCAQRRCAH